MPDAVTNECYECGAFFNTFRRKHHCRICGQIFCSKCCSNYISGKILKVQGQQRVCNKCHGTVDENMFVDGRFLGKNYDFIGTKNTEKLIKLCWLLSGENLNNSTASSPRTSQIDEKLSQRYSSLATRSGSDSDLSRNIEYRRRSSYAGYQTNNAFLTSESCDNLNLEPSQHVDMQRLVSIWQKLSDPVLKIQTGHHRYKMKSYVDSFLGDELIIWLYDYELVNLRKDAIDLAQALLDGELIEDVTNTFLGINDGLGGPRFQPNIPYKLKERRIAIPEESDELDPEWLQSIEVSNEAYRKVSDKKNDNFSDFSDSLTAPVDLDYYLKNSPSASMSPSSIPCPALEQVYLRYFQ